MSNENANIDALDLLTVLLSYVSLHIYENGITQNNKLNAIALDMENKLNCQEKMLKDIIERIKGLEDGNKTIH